MDKKTIFWIVCAGVLQTGYLHAEEAPPSIEFIEYLADTDTSNGDWVDPLEMKKIASNKQTDKSVQKQQTDKSERDHKDE